MGPLKTPTDATATTTPVVPDAPKAPTALQFKGTRELNAQKISDAEAAALKKQAVHMRRTETQTNLTANRKVSISATTTHSCSCCCLCFLNCFGLAPKPQSTAAANAIPINDVGNLSGKSFAAIKRNTAEVGTGTGTSTTADKPHAAPTPIAPPPAIVVTPPAITYTEEEIAGFRALVQHPTTGGIDPTKLHLLNADQLSAVRRKISDPKPPASAIIFGSEERRLRKQSTEARLGSAAAITNG